MRSPCFLLLQQQQFFKHTGSASESCEFLFFIKFLTLLFHLEIIVVFECCLSNITKLWLLIVQKFCTWRSCKNNSVGLLYSGFATGITFLPLVHTLHSCAPKFPLSFQILGMQPTCTCHFLIPSDLLKV